MVRLREVLAEDVRCAFPGRSPMSGMKEGIVEVMAFFDYIRGIMWKSKITAGVLVTGFKEDYVSECYHITIHRDDGNNLDHQW